jgi:glycosyltransferase involved in cell wall biosynthesis
MNISVILCTYNRCEDLRIALASVAASKMPESDGWDVLIVDNNSSDRTRDVAQDFCGRYPGRFKYLFEPRQGKSYALNTGIKEASGEILAFMDDDVTVDSQWLQNLTEGLHDSEWAGSGGRILLQWPSSVPNWLATNGPLARHGFPGFDQGDLAKRLDGPPFGTNMAYRKTMFEKYGGFRLDLGTNPKNHIRNEDTEFGRRLVAGGERLRYEPSAIVYHPVPEKKLYKKHFLRWGFDKGRADAREFKIRPVYLFFQIGAWTLKWMTTFDPCVRFHAKIIIWEKVGSMQEWARETFASKEKGKEHVEIKGKPA